MFSRYSRERYTDERCKKIDYQGCRKGRGVTGRPPVAHHYTPCVGVIAGFALRNFRIRAEFYNGRLFAEFTGSFALAPGSQTPPLTHTEADDTGVLGVTGNPCNSLILSVRLSSLSIPCTNRGAFRPSFTVALSLDFWRKQGEKW